MDDATAKRLAEVERLMRPFLERLAALERQAREAALRIEHLEAHLERAGRVPALLVRDGRP